ncbi:ABC transporter substrate-binding protein [Pseudonocardia sp.]|uniref:ABC transporter substrate-binding protein n=1 Tax=Pseudonocardia sp. TaxID=60912 RepID=UPI002F40F98A
MRRGPALLALTCTAACLGAAIAGCAEPPPPAGPAPGAAPLPQATGEQRLAGVCPSTIVIQDLWDPDANQAGEYQLVGPGYTLDAARKRVSGPLVVAGLDTGVRVEVRSGGAAIGFASVPAQMYVDKSITIGSVHGDLAMATSANQPVTAVIAPLNKSPQILMWDPATHPNWHSIADIGASGAKVVVAKDNYFPTYLVAKGLLEPDQIDTGYTGAPARFVTDPAIAQQGYATSEPYIYQHEVPSWGKPVGYQLISDVGYNIYPQAMSVRTADLGPLSGCLKRLVPVMQRAMVDYMRDPARTNQLIVDAVAKYNDGWTYSIGVANYAAETLKKMSIVTNDASGPIGGLDPVRVQATIDTFAPILARSGAGVRPGLKASDIATPQFLNPAIKLP